MDITIFETREHVARAAAQRVTEAVRGRPNLVLGFPAGHTPIPTYEELGRLHRSGAVDFSVASCFTIDEFVGLDRTSEGSFHQFLMEHLFSRLNFDPSRIRALDGAAVDLDAECHRYEADIIAAGGIDLQIVGLGRNGHVGFNEPDDTLVASTHRVVLREETRRDNATSFGGDPTLVPREALSMGIGTILRARAILMIATGETKAQPVEQMIRGGVTTRLPASFLQLHPAVEVYIDRAAAARL